MSKVNSKKIMSLVAIVALVAILGICLVACNADSVGKSLEKKDYNVVTLTENSGTTGRIIYGIAKNIGDFKEGVFATKGTNYVAVIWYETLDGAKEAEEAFKANPVTPVVHRADKVVYAGTQQGVKDAR